MLTSYAQNFEDVILWRALKHIESGFYIDIGAQDPVIDSVSLAFYEKGWRGVHVEPAPQYASRLRSLRADEQVVEAAISNGKKEQSFFIISDTGLSTGVRAIAENYKADGAVVKKIKVRSLRLSQLLDRYKSRDIHWLKIDVEGMEKSVIESWQPSRVRPWIVVVESTRPNSPEQSYQEWEVLVKSFGYKFAYFDGINRFYIHRKHLKLIHAFGAGPNYFDDYALYADSWMCRLAHAKFEGEMSAVRQEVKEQVAENLLLKDTVEELERKSKFLATLERASHQLSEHFTQSALTLEREVASIRTDNAIVGSDIRARVDQVKVDAKVHSTIEGLRAALVLEREQAELRNSEIERIRVEIDTARIQIAKKEEEIIRLNTKIEAANVEIALVRAKSETVERKIELANAALGVANDKVVARDDEISRLMTKIERASSETKILCEKLKRVEAEVATFNDLTDKAQLLETALEAAEKKIQAKDSNLNQIEAEVYKKDAKIEADAERIGRMEDELGKTKAKAEELNYWSYHNFSVMQSLKTEIEAVKASLSWRLTIPIRKMESWYAIVITKNVRKVSDFFVGIWGAIIRARSVEGCFDGIVGNHLEGWVWNARKPNKEIDVQLVIGTWRGAIERADNYRADLEAAGKGGGKHGYKIEVSSHVVAFARSSGSRIELQSVSRWPKILCSVDWPREPEQSSVGLRKPQQMQILPDTDGALIALAPSAKIVYKQLVASHIQR